MPFWRKKNDGFEWQRYVRTTVLARRRERRQRMEDAGAAAVFGVRRAGWRSLHTARRVSGYLVKIGSRAMTVLGQGVSAASKAGYRGLRLGASQLRSVSGSALRTIARAMKAGTARGLELFQRVIAPYLAHKSKQTLHALQPFFDFMKRPEMTAPVALIALISAVATIGHVYASGLNRQAVFAGLLAAAAALLVIGPRLRTLDGLGSTVLWRLPAFQVSRKHAAVAGTLALLTAVGTGIWYARGALPPMPEFPDFALFGHTIIEGRASALDGDHIRINGQTLKLEGIEAPEPGQRCEDENARAWRCGQSAQQRLSRLLHRNKVSCEIVGQTAKGTRTARCRTGDVDVARELVAQGYAFAGTGWFARYSSEEALAKDAKLGIWQGQSERPSDYRAGRWQDAAEKAPGGCPIKGRVRRGKRLYSLPWDDSYAKIRVRERRGGRWFCSEQDAREAGFQPASQS